MERFITKCCKACGAVCQVISTSTSTVLVDDEQVTVYPTKDGPDVCYTPSGRQVRGVITPEKDVVRGIGYYSAHRLHLCRRNQGIASSEKAEKARNEAAV